MCGITGLMSLRPGRKSSLESGILGMNAALRYRGPDGGDIWIDADVGVALGHRRLSVVDLSSAGTQPMHSQCGRWVIVYNGELYNSRSIAEDLPHVAWRGHSDTEVLLEACAAWGVDTAIERAAGMFAFALWDRRDRVLHLVRDRLGIKPLYWTRHDGAILFASELRGIEAFPGFTGEINPASVQAFLSYGCIPAPLTIFHNAHKLAPGHILSITANGDETLRRWWDPRRLPVASQVASDEDILDGLHGLLSGVVKDHLISDVPLGAFLSGGIDSSLVVSLMQQVSSGPVRTFSIGFQEKSFNEADAARAIASHLGTEHTELILEPQMALNMVPSIASVYDEPFADSSQLPTLIVSQLARRQVTVALSGDGGDEGFAGYTRYHGINRLWHHVGKVPLSMRRGLAGATDLLSVDAWDAMASVLPSRLRPAFAGDKLKKAAALLSEPGPEQMYQRIVSQWHELRHASQNSESVVCDRPVTETGCGDLVRRLQVADLLTYLPDDILTKVDRASMHVSLEVRVPLLDHRIIEYALAMPRHLVYGQGKGKLALRKLLARHLPTELFDQPKKGFGIPVGHWIQGPLRDWAEDLLSESALQSVGLLDVAATRNKFHEHLSGRRNWQYALWSALMLQAWFQGRKQDRSRDTQLDAAHVIS